VTTSQQAVPTLDLEFLNKLERLWSEHMAELNRVVGPEGPAHTTVHYMRWQMAYNDAFPQLLALARSASEAKARLERLESALELATSALVTIDDTRGPPATQRQSAAVDELRRIIGVCRLALGKVGG